MPAASVILGCLLVCPPTIGSNFGSDSGSDSGTDADSDSGSIGAATFEVENVVAVGADTKAGVS